MQEEITIAGIFFVFYYKTQNNETTLTTLDSTPNFSSTVRIKLHEVWSQLYTLDFSLYIKLSFRLITSIWLIKTCVITVQICLAHYSKYVLSIFSIIKCMLKKYF